MKDATDPVPLDDYARSVAPHLDIVSISQPVPVLHEHNVVFVTDTATTAREAVLELERLERDDARLGMVVMGKAADVVASTREGVDPQGVTGPVGRRVALGAAIGAVVGAVLVGLAVALFDLSGVVWGAAAGGAALGAVIGAVWTVFAGLGGSDAYRQSYVDDSVTDLHIVTLHTDDRELVVQVRERLDGHHHVDLLEVDAGGHRPERRP